MKYILLPFLLGSALFIFSCNRGEELQELETGGGPMPEAWIDEDTGHKVVRLSQREGSNRSFYFHNSPFVQASAGAGDKMVFYGTVADQNQLFSIDLQSKGINQLTAHPNNFSGEIIGKQSRRVYYQSQDSVFATHIDTGETSLVYVFPEGFKATISTLNADETLLAGVHSTPEKAAIYEKYPKKSDYFNRIFEAKLPHTLFTVNIETQELDTLHTENTWIGHVQFSPKAPNQLMFCHEGPWHEVDRIWNIDVATGEIKKMHERTVHREIAGHEFWSPDGEVIWYDLQIPRGETFYLSGANVKTGERRRYALERDEWSIHFNISPDQQYFAGDGGDPGQVAKAADGMWIYHFTPEGDRLKSKKLVNMKNHDYSLEPNVHFSPDGEWIIFRANFEGESQVYAVEIAEHQS